MNIKTISVMFIPYMIGGNLAKQLRQAKQDDDKKRFFFFLHSLQMTRFHFYGWMTTTFSPFVLSLTEDNKAGLFITFATTKQTYFYHLDKNLQKLLKIYKKEEKCTFFHF